MGFQYNFVYSIDSLLDVYFVNALVHILFFSYDISFIFILILILSGDIEVNPGPTKHRKCRMLYTNIRGLHANLNDLIVASRQYDISFCSETLVSNLRHSSELLIPSFKKPILF